MNQTSRYLFKKLINQRCFHTTTAKLIDPKNVEEIRIPVPWGHIAGKWWGNKNSPTFLALHGLLDNASSFDKLIPQLNVPSVLCLDLPGHGLSSHIPRGISINYIDYIEFLRYLLKHKLKWDKVSLLGHSYGSSLCFSYCGIFPDCVETMINIDCSRLVTADQSYKTDKDFRDSIEGFVACDLDTERNKGFSWDETLKHMYNSRIKSRMPLTMKSCEIIARRATEKVGPDLYTFNFDRRLKYRSFARFTFRMNQEFAKRIKCPTLNIQAEKGIFSVDDPELSRIKNEEMNVHFTEISNASKRFVNATASGTHHVHLEEPEKISTIINDFLK